MENNNGGNPNGRTKWFTDENGIVKKNAWNSLKTVSPELEKYIENICNLKTLNRKYSIYVQYQFGSDARNVHTDNARTWALFYPLETGGDDVYTSWYVEPGKSIVREYEPSLSHIDDNRKFQKVFSIQLLPKTWYFVNVSVLHSVSQAFGLRRILYVGFGREYLSHIDQIPV